MGFFPKPIKENTEPRLLMFGQKHIYSEFATHSQDCGPFVLQDSVKVKELSWLLLAL